MRKIAVFSLAFLLVLPLQGCDYLPDFLKVLWKRPKVAAEKGHFKGTLVVAFESLPTGDGQTVELIQLEKDYGYKDSKGRDWDVPAGEISDGASIPWPLWTIVGGPFSGPYRQAAVIHDYYCAVRTRRWQDVHLMFYEAALKAGTGKRKAQFMYSAILMDGPRWPDPGKKAQLNQSPRADTGKPVKAAMGDLPVIKVQSTTTSPSAGAQPGTQPATDPKTCNDLISSVAGKKNRERFIALKQWIEREKPTLKDIQTCVAELRKLRR